jgi:putative salt-induced outer membrane protein YdiY
MGIKHMMQWNQKMQSGLWASWIAIGLLLMAGVSFAEDAAEEEEGAWSGEVNVSIAATSGTIDTFSGSIDTKAERTWDEVDVVGVRFVGVYGTKRERNDGSRTSTETIQNAQELSARWKHTIHKRFFWLTPTSASRDSVQELEVRYAISSGPGYRLWMPEDKPAKRHFDVSAGPGYRYEIWDGNTGAKTSTGAADTGENGDSSHFADMVVGFEYQNLFFDEKIEYTHTGSARMPANDTASYILRSELIFDIPLTAGWAFRTGFVVEYTANPGTDEITNTTTRTSVGLGYKF